MSGYQCPAAPGSLSQMTQFQELHAHKAIHAVTELNAREFRWRRDPFCLINPFFWLAKVEDADVMVMDE